MDRSRPIPREGNPGRIVVRAPNWLGDLMMETGALRAILERWPDAAVDLVVRAGREALPFLMAEFMNVPYVEVVKAAVISGDSILHRGLRRGAF